MKAAKVRPSVFTKDTSVSDQGAPKEPAEETKDSGCQVQQQNITVELSVEFQDVLNELIAQVRPLLSRLQDNGVIPRSKTLSTLNPEYTRFVLKQAEMSVRKTEENNLETQIFCMTVCLHALVSCVDILMQSGLEAATGKVVLHLVVQSSVYSLNKYSLKKKMASPPIYLQHL